MPQGKPAGVPCVQLDDQLGCRLFGRPERPAFCASLQPEPAMCGASRGDALAALAWLERMTRPGAAAHDTAGPDPGLRAEPARGAATPAQR